MQCRKQLVYRPRYSGNRRPQQTGSNYRVHKKKQFSQKLGTGHCGNCGYQHKPVDSCPAKGKQCDSCKKWNHFAKVCRSKLNVNISQNSHVHGVSTQPEQSDSESDNFFIDSIQSKYNVKNDQAFVKLLVGPHSSPIEFKLDTGSQANIIPEYVYDELGLCGILQIPKRTLSAYNGSSLRTLGVCRLPSTYKQNTQDVEFYVVDTISTPILRLQSCLNFELIKLVYSIDTTRIKGEQVVKSRKICKKLGSVVKPSQNTSEKASLCNPQSKYLDKPSVLKQYPDIFKGIGLFPGECKIHIDPSVIPVVHPPRRIPFALCGKLKLELDRMEKANIITKVSTPTEWVNSLVVVEKPLSNKLRICLDPKDPNKAILRPHYPMRKLEDLLPELTGAKYFTKLDARSGYWAIRLSEDSSYLTTFNTPFGRFRFCRLPFGLKSSQDEFQRKIYECYESLQGVVAIVDDILVYGHTREEHDQNLRSVLNRSKEKGVRLNKETLTK